MYRQKQTCPQEEVAFQSKVVIMIEIIKPFEPPEEMITHVLLDSWYSLKAIWKAEGVIGEDDPGYL